MGNVPEELAREFEQLEPAMLDWAAMITRDDGLAEEAVQEAFLRAIRAASRFNGNSSLKTWLLKITRNCCYNLIKKRRRHRSVEADLADRPDGQSPPERSAETADELARLKRQVDRLPDVQREAFVLRHVHEMPYERIAEIVGVPTGTVKSRLHHAVASLRTAMLENES